MQDEINNLVSTLRTEMDAAQTNARQALDELATKLATTADTRTPEQQALLSEIRDQISVALAEVERFDSTLSGQLNIAKLYAQALAS